MKQPTNKIIQQLVEAMKFMVSVTDSQCTDNLDGTYTIQMCNTAWLSCGVSIINYDTDEVLDVVSVTIDESITVKGSECPSSFTVEAPNFIHGSFQMTNAELQMERDANEKFPLIYLHERIREKVYHQSDNKLERESEIVLYFLHQSNYKDWLTGDHYVEVVPVMRKMAYEFMNVVSYSTRIEDVDSYDVEDLVNFGKYNNDKGNVVKLLDDDTSGVELRVTLPIKPEEYCNLRKCK